MTKQVPNAHFNVTSSLRRMLTKIQKSCHHGAVFIPCGTGAVAPCLQTAQHPLWCRNNCVTVTRESLWESTGMSSAISTVMQLKIVQHGLRSSVQLVSNALLVSKALVRLRESSSLLGAVRIEPIAQIRSPEQFEKESGQHNAGMNVAASTVAFPRD
jgi:hypothetical protein